MNSKIDVPVSIGFDIGISSVGLAVIDAKNGSVLEAVSDIFSEGSSEDNKDRRSARHSRRSSGRKNTRLRDSQHLLQNIGFIKGDNVKLAFREIAYANQKVYELRVKGLTERLTKDEISAVIQHMIKRRGVSYDLKDYEDEEESKKTSNYKASVAINQQLLKTYTPGQIQLDRLHKFGKIRGMIESDGNVTLRNIFTTTAYALELEKILRTQQKYHPELTDDIIDKFLKILKRKRDYSKGPGSKKSLTNYGIYKTDGRVLDNLYEELIGKDKYFPTEQRAASNTYTAQYFNMLNDLNNLKILNSEDGKLTLNQKKNIVDEILNSDAARLDAFKVIMKVTKANKNEITGYRIDAKSRPLLHSMKIYRRVKREMASLGISTDQWSDKVNINGEEHIFWDDLAYIISLNDESGELRKRIIRELKYNYEFVDNKLVDAIVDNKKLFAVDSGNKWHNFSLKTMKLLIPELENTSKEQMTILTDLHLTKKDKIDYRLKNKIDVDHILKDIYNPVVKRSVRHAIRMFNVIVKKYTNIEYVVIELPRDRNSAEEKKSIQKFQKDSFNEKDLAMKAFADKLGKSTKELDVFFHKNRKLATKVRLWYQQEGRCLYSGETIPAIELLNNSEAYDIDHIIPISVSFDDSLNNKTLCLGEMNQRKGNRIPWAMFNDGFGQGYTQMCHMLKNNKRLSKQKKHNLETRIDINDLETRKRFIARNLVDTRWASRVVFNELQDFVKAKGLATKVSVVRGKFTARLRREWQIYKTRDTYYHHAKDAAIIAVTPYLDIWKKNNYKMVPKQVGEGMVDIDTGEIISENKFNSYMYSEPFTGFVKNVRRMDRVIKIKHTADMKMNRKLSDATIYSVRDVKLSSDRKNEPYRLGKLNIYNLKDYKTLKKLITKTPDKILMYHHDPKTFAILQEIMDIYPDKIDKKDVSPFELYRRENGKVRKYAKKNNGPEITEIKYYDKKVNSCIDITPEDAKNKRSVLLSLKPWRSDVYFNHTKNNYEVIGLKYNDISEVNDLKGIKREHYNHLLRKQVGNDKVEFCFSLYRNSIIKIINDGEDIELRFGSSKTQRNKVILKPIDRALFNSYETVKIYRKASNAGIIERSFSKPGYVILKANIDELGNRHYLRKEEGPKDIL